MIVAAATQLYTTLLYTLPTAAAALLPSFRCWSQKGGPSAVLWQVAGHRELGGRRGQRRGGHGWALTAMLLGPLHATCARGAGAGHRGSGPLGLMANRQRQDTASVLDGEERVVMGERARSVSLCVSFSFPLQFNFFHAVHRSPCTCSPTTSRPVNTRRLLAFCRSIVVPPRASLLLLLGCSRSDAPACGRSSGSSITSPQRFV